METKNPNYFITSDSTADIPSMLIDGDFDRAEMSYVLDGVLHDGKTNAFLSNDKFYELMKEGKTAQTSMLSVSDVTELFERHLKEGKDVLHISFSSGMSGTYESCLTAKSELAAKYPERQIAVIDSKAATGGEGLLVYYAMQNRKNGMTISENEKAISSIVDNVVHLFTVNDMMHLYRGGRITKAKAIAGLLAHIKPILIVNEEGKLETIGKASGTALALKALSDNLSARTKEFDNDVIFITHTGVPEIAEKLKQKVSHLAKAVYVTECSPIIGAHLGFGSVTVFALGSSKKAK